MMDMWKWNLAFQCLVNIGVRGSEGVRTRVVEADMVPVIATILDNYIQVIEKCKAKAEEDIKRTSNRMGSSGRHFSRSGERLGSSASHRSERMRRQAPPPIDIPPASTLHTQDVPATEGNSLPAFSLSSPPERTHFPRHHHHRSHDSRSNVYAAPGGPGRQQGIPPMDTPESFGLRPVREVDRLPSMLAPTVPAGATSQPESPTTPGPTTATHATTPRPSQSSSHTRRRPSIRHQVSMSGDSDGDQNDDIASDDSTLGNATEPIVGIQNDINMQDMVDQEELLDAGATPVALTNQDPLENTETETFNITHRSADGSIINPATTQTNGVLGMSPVQPPVNVINATPPAMQVNWYPRFINDRAATASFLAAMPRDEDVLMSLQLLAYVSKYCNLRSYFQQSHLVPRLKIGADLAVLDGETPPPNTKSEEEWDEEYLLHNDFNIFPLVEKFTVRHHSQDMQYWAGVVMRNLCRKDDAHGGIRQCAWYKCGKWEEYTRQFAKCRRCRRTKYCSKECQKLAWVFHRHWCIAAQQ